MKKALIYAFALGLTLSLCPLNINGTEVAAAPKAAAEQGQEDPQNKLLMPDLSGMYYKEAEAELNYLLKKQGINKKVSIGWGHNSNPAKNCLVASSTPNVGEEITSDTSLISIMVYEGYNEPGTVTPTKHSSLPMMPELDGKDYNEAGKELDEYLNEKGLTTPVSVEYISCEDKDKEGQVRYTTPLSYTVLDENTEKITLYVYEESSDKLVMPDLTGMYYREAEAELNYLLKKNGIDKKVSIGWGHNSNPAKNCLVASTTPNIGEAIKADDFISLMVYEGYNEPYTVTPTKHSALPMMPELYLEDHDEAVAKLQALLNEKGLDTPVETKWEECDDDESAGKISGTDPLSFTVLDESIQKITLTAYKAKETTPPTPTTAVPAPTKSAPVISSKPEPTDVTTPPTPTTSASKSDKLIMPDLTGMYYKEAEAEIKYLMKQNGLDLKVVTGWGHNSNPAKNCLVAQTTPSAGEEIIAEDLKSGIIIMVYEGYNDPYTVTPEKHSELPLMPSLSGKDYKEAQKELSDYLKSKGLDYPVEIEWYTSEVGGYQDLVASTTPSAYEVLDENIDKIIIEVYRDKAPDITITPPTDEPDITGTPETSDKVKEFVERLYKDVLGRDAEEGGVNFWTEELKNFKRTGAEVAQSFILSDEFINAKKSDEEFVSILYKAFFNREPDQEGIAFWTKSISTGTPKTDVAQGFIFSQEWADTCASFGILSGTGVKPSVEIAPSDATKAFVERMYTTAMNRESDAAGAKFWAQGLSNFEYTGEQVGVFFFLSDEMNSFNLSDEEFVTRLYKTFMDREPEEGGFKFWVDYLKDGSSREGAVLGFSRSAEFVGKCVDAKILPY